MNSVLLIVLGWLLGLLAPAIVERIRRERRSAELMRAIMSELEEVRYQMAFVAYLMRSRRGGLGEVWFRWFALIVRNYSGPNRIQIPHDLLEKGEKMSDAQWKEWPPGDPKRGMSLKQHSASLLAAHFTEIAALPMQFQVAALQVRSRLDLYNQHVVHLQRQFDLTFSVSGEYNRTALRTNLEEGYQQLDEMARRVADAISNVPGLRLGS